MTNKDELINKIKKVFERYKMLESYNSILDNIFYADPDIHYTDNYNKTKTDLIYMIKENMAVDNYSPYIIDKVLKQIYRIIIDHKKKLDLEKSKLTYI